MSLRQLLVHKESRGEGRRKETLYVRAQDATLYWLNAIGVKAANMILEYVRTYLFSFSVSIDRSSIAKDVLKTKTEENEEREKGREKTRIGGFLFFFFFSHCVPEASNE